MNYQVRVARSAEKELDRIPQELAARMETALKLLRVNPRPQQTKKLKDSPYYRLRTGNYRILYLINDKERQVIIEHIGHRKDVYRY